MENKPKDTNSKQENVQKTNTVSIDKSQIEKLLLFFVFYSMRQGRGKTVQDRILLACDKANEILELNLQYEDFLNKFKKIDLLETA